MDLEKTFIKGLRLAHVLLSQIILCLSTFKLTQ